MKKLLPELMNDYRSDSFPRLMRKLPDLYDKLSVEEIAQLLASVTTAQAEKIAGKMAKEEMQRYE